MKERRSGAAGAPAAAFYARAGSLRGDLFTLLHPPYTAWHLSYVIYGAALAPQLDIVRLAGTLTAFFFGTGVAAHAFDEWRSRPLHTGLSDRLLLTCGACAVAACVVLGVAGASMVSPWVLAWTVSGVALMASYTLEWNTIAHSDVAFGLAWGGFPVLVGYWVQAERISVGALLVALAATLLSLAQRALSTPARYTRRTASEVIVEFERSTGFERWSRDHLLATWESPLKLLCASTIALAGGLLAMRL